MPMAFPLARLPWRDITPRAITEQQKNFLRSLASIALDRMELQKVKADLQETVATTEAARQDAVTSHAELRQVIECLPQAVVLLDAQNNLILWNKNYETMFPGVAPYVKPGSQHRNALPQGLREHKRHFQPGRGPR